MTDHKAVPPRVAIGHELEHLLFLVFDDTDKISILKVY